MAKHDLSERLADVFSALTIGIGKVLYLLIALTLLGIALGMIGYSLFDVWLEIKAGRNPTRALLDAIALTVLSLAIIDVSKYLLDEEVIRSRELRAAGEARRTLTKFLTIISIAVSLEALVLIFGGTRDNATDYLFYAGFLLFAVVALVVALGAYQWLSAKSEQLTGKAASSDGVSEKP